MENRYQPARILFYLVREGNKRPLWNRMIVKQIHLYRPQVMEVNDCLVINNHLRSDLSHWNSIVEALEKEAEKLYPEFKGRVILFDDENKTKI